MQRLSFLKCVAVLDQIIEATSSLLVKPQDVVAETAGIAAFNCCTNLDEGIRWMYATNTNSEMQDHIYSGGFTYPQWRKRHKVSEGASGFFTLTIDPVDPTDAGYYSCMDIKDDSYFEAKLVVTRIHEWTTTESWTDLHTSEHSMVYKRSMEHVILGIVLFGLLIILMVALCQRMIFKSGKLFRPESQNESNKVLMSDLPSYIKYLLAIYFNRTRNPNGEIEAPGWHTLVKEKCATENEEETIYMITK